jgi:hypothetical protein
MTDTDWLTRVPEGLATAIVAAFVTLAVRWWDRRKSEAEADAIGGEELRAIIKSQREYIDWLSSRLAESLPAETKGGG